MKKLLGTLGVCLLFVGIYACDDDPFFFGFPPFNDGVEFNCPIPVPTPEPFDPEPTPTPTPPPGDGDGDGDHDDGRPANGQQCEVNEFAVCHIPRGNPDNYFTICVGSENAFEAHLNHGDVEGYCEDLEE